MPAAREMLRTSEKEERYMKEYVTVEAKGAEELNERLNAYAKESFSLVSYQCHTDVFLAGAMHFAIMEKEPDSNGSEEHTLVCEGIPFGRLEEICNAERSGGVLVLPGGDKIEGLGLSVRSYNCLKDAGYDTISRLLQICDADLQMVKNLGRVSFFEIKDKLSALIENGMRKGGPGSSSLSG